jgi:hypothetical protein
VGELRVLISRKRKLKIRYQEKSSENIAEEQPLLRAVTKQRLV